ncbi:MAG TPA: DUF6159 family protein [Chitinophagaceae bacterium]|nr:DUF6159 family protein [Chitinophagaceae bacterium]
MSIFDRFSNGWTIAKTSFKVLKANRQLIIFPVLSGLSITLILGSFITFILAGADWQFANLDINNKVGGYALLFVFYVINYFIVVFFNMALMHCTRIYFEGGEVNVSDGIKFSLSRLGVIFSWSIMAATVGLILKIIQENVGSLGKIITGIIGVVWSIATFFVVPVLAYEKLGPVDALKRSAQLMRQKWGESLGAGFSFGLIHFVALIVVGIPALILGVLVNPILGIVVVLLAIFLLAAVFSTLRSIFVSAVYNNITGNLDEHFNQQMIDGLFVQKKK